MKILLTGAGGFIGSYFVKHYERSYHIIPFSFSADDFTKLSLAAIDVVVHLSALVHEKGKVGKDSYWRINVDNTEKLAIKSKQFAVKQFIFISTIKVFGEENNIAYNENSQLLPQDDYAKSKLAAEQVLQHLADTSFKVAIIRTPIVYGKGVKANLLSLMRLVKLMPVLPFKNTNNKRTMVYIANLCAMLDKIIAKRVSGVFLAGDDSSISTSELIKLIAKYQNKHIRLYNIPFFTAILAKVKPQIYRRLYDNLVVDNTLSKQKLGITKQLSLASGIENMCNENSI